MNKFTKIRKWAEEKGMKIEEKTGYGGKPCIGVIINDQLNFEVEERDSTIYRSIKGIRGKAKGIYLSINRNGRYGYGIRYSTQMDIIRIMESEMVQRDSYRHQ